MDCEQLQIENQTLRDRTESRAAVALALQQKNATSVQVHIFRGHIRRELWCDKEHHLISSPPNIIVKITIFGLV